MMVARSLMLGLACSRPGGEELSTLRSGNSGSGIPKLQEKKPLFSYQVKIVSY